MVDLSVSLSGVKLSNPVIPASGTFGFGYEFADLYDIDILGSISLKGSTLKARYGNPLPRIAEKLAQVFHKPAIANISGFSIDEYVECAALFDADPHIGLLEINVSCPNVHGGGMSFGTDPACAAEVTRAVKAAVKKPVYIKLTPNVTDIAAVARACEEAGADGLSLINTLLGMRIDPRTRRPVLANIMGGLSGPAVFPVALRMVWQVYEAVSVPIIGMGGISSAENVIEMLLAGATAVQVGAANLTDPFACKRIIEELPAAMAKYGIDNLTNIIGGAHHG